MTKRNVVRLVFEKKKPPYVPWSFGFTHEAHEKLKRHFGADDIEPFLGNHMVSAGGHPRFFTPVGNGCVRDYFGAVWDRSVDQDIGVVANRMLPGASLSGYTFPDPLDPWFFDYIPAFLARTTDRFRLFSIGFSLYERAWTLRGMENLMMDFHDHPAFVRELFNTIADYNIAQVTKALEYDFDAIYFGDDWGSQRGLQMGPSLWREFIKPVLKRMYGVVKKSGRFVYIHSCGDVDELFDELIDIGLDCFNPFQPEVMDVWSLLPKYRGRLSFHGGLSTQQTLPFGSVEDVRNETRRLIALGSEGGYILSPAHAVEGDVPLENMLAFIGEVKRQDGYEGA